jgi:hypothetical protein
MCALGVSWNTAEKKAMYPCQQTPMRLSVAVPLTLAGMNACHGRASRGQ